MVRIAALKPFVQVGVCLAICALLLNGALLGLSRASILHWPPEKVTGSGFLQDSRQRVTDASEQYKAGIVDPHDYLGAIVGISNVREGMDLQTLRSETAAEHWRFLGIAGAGSNLQDAQDYADMILQSDIRPDLVVFGATPLQLLDTMLTDYVPPTPQLGGPGPRDETSNPNVSPLVETLKSSVWIYNRRKDISLSVQEELVNLRAALFKKFDVHLRAADAAGPWREMLKAFNSERFPDWLLKNSLSFAEGKGAFNAASYDESIRAAAILRKIVGRFVERGAKVMVVLTPEHSWMRAREPASISNYVQNTLLGSFSKKDVHFKDYRAAVTDDGFRDLVHLNSHGSAWFSKLLATDIKQISIDHPSLMSEHAGRWSTK